MSANSHYFSHDTNTIMDSKIQALISKYGAKGYGIFWRIVEMLHQYEEHQIPLKKYEFMAIANQMLSSASEIEAIIKDMIKEFELFHSDGDFFWSDRVNRNIDKMKDISEKRAKNGRKGGLSRSDKASNKQNNSKSKHLLSKNEQIENKIYNNNTPLPPKGEADSDLASAKDVQKSSTSNTSSKKKSSIGSKDFEFIYNIYPRKVGKHAALKAIQKSIVLIAQDKSLSEKEAFDYLVNQTKAYAKQRANQDQQFTPHPQTWFNQGRYDDEGLKPNAYQSQSNPNEIPEGYEDHEELLKKFKINGFLNYEPLIINTITVNGRKYSKHRTQL